MSQQAVAALADMEINKAINAVIKAPARAADLGNVAIRAEV